jgi:hypothetical protein
VTKRFWAHVVEGETLELAMQAVYSFCPLKKEHWSVLGRSWDDGRDRNHLLLMHLHFGFGSPVSTVFTAVGLVRHSRLGNELSAIALVDTCFTVGVDLALVVVVDAGTSVGEKD